MLRWLLVLGILLLPSAVQAQNAVCATNVCTLLLTPPSKESIAAKAARWAVDLQLRNWLGKKAEDLSREELDKAVVDLKALRNWALGLSNAAFAGAYSAWVSEVEASLVTRRSVLDNEGIARALLLGLPTPPKR